MENITTGHWIFAGLFFIAFTIYLVWGYRKDLKLHRLHYNKAFYAWIALVLILFTFFVFKQIL